MSGNPNSLSSIDMQDILQRLMTAAGSDGSQTPVERMEELMSMMRSLGSLPSPETAAHIAQLQAMMATQEGRDRLNNSSELMNVVASGAEKIRGVLEDAMEKKKSSSGKARVDRLQALQGLKLKVLKELARDNNVDLKGLREKREVGS